MNTIYKIFQRFLKENNMVLIFLLVITWRIYYALPQILGGILLRQHPGYIGESIWANLDGMHYLSIAKIGYQTYEQAFFPLFPLSISFVSSFLPLSLLNSGFIVVYVSLFCMLIMFWKLVSLYYSSKVTLWSMLFLLAFPTSFFFYALYTESMFFCFIFCAFYFAKKEKYFVATLFGVLASATRLVGVFLLPAILIDIYLSKRKKLFTSKNVWSLLFIPVGLIGYMVYLGVTFHDPLLFIHSQPAFGAGRSGGQIILLPQVVWRYIKILVTISPSNYDFFVAFLELFVFSAVCILLLVAWKKKNDIGFITFGILSILLPTLSGTLSSLPRYSLSAFVICILFARFKSLTVKIFIFCILLLFQFILAMYFLQGYFVS